VPTSLLGQNLTVLHCVNFTVKLKSHSFKLSQLHCQCS